MPIISIDLRFGALMQRGKIPDVRTCVSGLMQVNAGQLRTKISRLVQFRTKPLRFNPCG
jgi:hypothetical protein